MTIVRILIHLHVFVAGDKDTQVCGVKKMKCMKETQGKLLTTKVGKAFHDKCDCLPACTFIKYNAQVLRRPMDTSNLNKAMGSEI